MGHSRISQQICQQKYCAVLTSAASFLALQVEAALPKLPNYMTKNVHTSLINIQVKDRRTRKIKRNVVLQT